MSFSLPKLLCPFLSLLCPLISHVVKRLILIVLLSCCSSFFMFLEKSRTPVRAGFLRCGQTKRSEALVTPQCDTTLPSMRSKTPASIWAETPQYWQRMSLQKPAGTGKRKRTVVRGWEGVKESNRIWGSYSKWDVALPTKPPGEAFQSPVSGSWHNGKKLQETASVFS